jgi:TonB family protein
MRRLVTLFLALLAPALLAQSPEFSGPYRVGGDVKAPVVIKRVEPQYTEMAKRDRIAGIAILEILVTRDGDVREATVLKGLPGGLSESAVDAVKQWKFRPGTINGQPVDVLFNITVNFRPDSADTDPMAATRPYPVPPQAASRPALTTVILVRHAEKETDPALADPPLTAAGSDRARSLARILRNAGITTIYTTPYARTRATAAHIAEALGLTPLEVQTGPTYVTEMVRRAVEVPRGATILVVGHSNTTRDVLRGLGVANAPEIPDAEYDNLYIVTLAPFAEPKLVALKY